MPVTKISLDPNLSERTPAGKAIKKAKKLKELTTSPIDIELAPKCFAYKGIKGNITPCLKKNKK